MKILTTLIALSLLSTGLFAQTSNLLTFIDPAQSSPSIKWQQLENKHVKVIYPDFLNTQANFIANLVEHYSSVVGTTYGINSPKKFPLILRPELAQPNGFVTLSPRRSEWYTSSIFTPIIGGLNFYQSLAIHEYRHVNQFDYMHQGTNNYAYALFGDFGLSLAIGLGLTPWFLEGDAVWAETKYSDAGRGRSPRFAARLKALILRDQVPTYDEFLAGTYKTKYPNHYVYGYFLTARAYKVYGPDFWKKVLEYVSRFSFYPYAITNAFKFVSGKDFEDFYNETMSELKYLWLSDKIVADNSLYSESFYPVIDHSKLYYLKKDLDTFWGLYKHGSSKPIIELDVTPELSQIDVKDDKFVYTQFLPSSRYGFKAYSDLFLYNLNTKEKKHILKDTRVYHPEFSPDANKIVVTHHGDQGQWSLIITDLDGNLVQELAFKDQIISEATWKNSSTLIAIVQNIDGKKQIYEIDISTKKTKLILNSTRNNIYALNSHKNWVYFEADYKGKVQVFRIDTATNQVAKCTDEPIAAYNPLAKDKYLYYISEQASGKKLKSQAISCLPMSISVLEGSKYIGDSPSDNYLDSAPLEFNNFEQVVNNKLPKSDYSEFTDRLRPHSWSFFSGRGIDLSITGTNYLNSFGYTLGAGRDSEEKRPFAYFNLSYSKYYPIFSLQVDYRAREDEDSVLQTKSRWEEFEANLYVTLPYRFKKGLYRNYFALTAGAGKLKYTKDVNARVYELSDETLDILSGEFTFYSLKDLRFREIYPSYGVRYNAVFKNAKAKEYENFSSDVFYQNLDLYLPTPFKNNGLKLSGYREKQSKGFFNYRHDPINDAVSEYVFSRGFSYSYVDLYTKFSADYLFPIAYPDFDLNGYAFLRRIYAKVFFDHTKAEILNYTRNLNSTGGELLFETYLLRKLDLTLGVRGSQKIDDDVVYDFFLGTDIAI